MRALMFGAVLGAVLLTAGPAGAWMSSCGSVRSITGVVAASGHPVIAWAGTVDLPEPALGFSTVDAVGFWNPDSDAWVRVLRFAGLDLACIYDSGPTLPPWMADS